MRLFGSTYAWKVILKFWFMCGKSYFKGNKRKKSFSPFLFPRSLKSPPLSITHQTKSILQTHPKINLKPSEERMEPVNSWTKLFIWLPFHDLYFNEVFIDYDYDIHILNYYLRHYSIQSQLSRVEKHLL